MLFIVIIIQILLLDNLIFGMTFFAYKHDDHTEKSHKSSYYLMDILELSQTPKSQDQKI